MRHITLVPGCLISIRDETELLPKTEQALSLARQALTARQDGAPGPGDVRGLKTIVEKLQLVVDQTRSSSAPADWKSRAKQTLPLRALFEKGWDPKDDLGKLLYAVGNSYAFRNPVAIVSDVPEFEQALEEALPLAQKSLQERKQEKPGAGTVEQLEWLVRYLRTVDGHRASGKYPSKRQRQSKAVGPMFADGWDPRDYLGVLISSLDFFYTHTDAW